MDHLPSQHKRNDLFSYSEADAVRRARELADAKKSEAGTTCCFYMPAVDGVVLPMSSR
jgi:hypothetical protein